MTPQKFTKKETALPERMITAWKQFAATEDPGWNQYNTDTRRIKALL